MSVELGFGAQTTRCSTISRVIDEPVDFRRLIFEVHSVISGLGVVLKLRKAFLGGEGSLICYVFLQGGRGESGSVLSNIF